MPNFFGLVAVAATFRGAAAAGGADFGAVALDRRGRLDRAFAAGGSCRVTLPGRQSAVDVVAVGGRAVVLGGAGKKRWLRVCPSVP